MGDGTVTWRELLVTTTAELGNRSHARWMCEIASGVDGEDFRRVQDEPATERMVAHLDAMIARRQLGEPLQYVLGRWQFRTLDLIVDRRVLIPRPETEWVTEAALGLAREMQARPLRIVDLGTGSGAIGLSLAAELPIGAAQVWLVDASADALNVARANLAGLGRAGAAVRIAAGSWYGALPAELLATVDIVVSNPPYVAVGDPQVEREVLEWEPHEALFAGVDGLDDIRTIVAGATEWLRPGGLLVIEIGADQGRLVATLLEGAGLQAIEISPDLAGRDRIAIGRAPTG